MELTAFEYVTRKKIRFATERGYLSLEDLFDLPLTSTTNKPCLNDVAKTIHRSMAEDETSFVPSEGAAVDFGARMQLEAVKRVIAIKVAERTEAATARDKAAQKQELLEALAEAERGEIKKLTPEEIRAKLAAL